MRKLGILVVYAFQERELPLFDLHMKYIRANTPPGFRVYAAVNRLDANLRAHLDDFHEIFVHDCDEVPSALRGREEHAALLEALARRAIVDGCDSLVSLHLDSFPVAPNWIGDIEKTLRRGAAFAALVPHRYSACMAWTPEFQSEGVSLLVPKEAMATAEYKAFQVAFPEMSMAESGIGFIYHAWREGLDWHGIEPVSEHVFGGTVFHLRAGLQKIENDEPASDLASSTEKLRKLAEPLLNSVPASMRGVLLRGRGVSDFRPNFPSADEETAQFEALLADPETFIGY